MTTGLADDETPSQGPDPISGPARRHTRRLEDKLLIAFHHACDVNDLEVARHVLQVLELMLARKPLAGDSGRRRTMEGLVAAYERLWHIRNRQI